MAAVITRLVSTPSRLMGRSPRNGKMGSPTTADEPVESDAPIGRNSHEHARDASDQVAGGARGRSGQGFVLDGAVADDESITNNNEQEEHVASESKNQRGRKRKRRGASESEASALASGRGESASEQTSSNAGDWEGESEADGGAEPGNISPNHCIFCGEDEEHDPSEEFEEYLTCTTCGNNAHRQCAREAGTLKDDEAGEWRCVSCTAHDQTAPSRRDLPMNEMQLASAKRIARELLPPQRNMRHGSHSIFNKLILDDDVTEGSRSLRKRKVSNEDTGEVRKRHRTSTAEADPKASIAVHSVTPEPKAEILDTVIEEATDNNSLAARKRGRSQRITERKLIRIAQHTDDHLILAIKYDASKFDSLIEERRKRRRREREAERRAEKARARDPPLEEISHYPALQASSFATQFFMHEREGDEPKPKPYGGILSETEADTQKTFPQVADRKKFEDARLKAEDEWRKKIMAAAAAAENARPGQKVSGPPSKIKCINFGGYEIDTWHAAPYPEEYSRSRVLYICEFCLKYMNSDFVAWRHKLKCPAKHPPGDEIYRDGAFSFFEVDGRKNPVYCQNLCLLAKLFLGSKTLYYDVEPFLFYIMTENDEYGCHFVGYFSKEKRPSSLNNVSCILVLPIHQRRGFGHYLIDFSYLLTRVEKKTGSPEKPLSDMGLVSYRSYWRLIMCYQLLEQHGSVSIATISDQTGMTADDIVSALEGLRALVRDPVTKTYALRLDLPFFRQYIDSYEKKGYAKVNPNALTWVPYVMGRDNMHYENAAPLHTVAQRDEGDEMEEPEEGVQLEMNGARPLAHLNTQLSEDITMGESEAEAEASPFPPLAPLEPSLDDSPVAEIPHTKITPSTPFTKPSERTSPIPATRFEVYPPLPGTALRRRPGRPYGRGNRRSTPVSRNLAFGDVTLPLTRPSSTRKSRSKLSEAMTGDQEDEEEEEADMLSEDEIADNRRDAAADVEDEEDAEGEPDDEDDAEIEIETDSDDAQPERADVDTDAAGDEDEDEEDEDAEGELDDEDEDADGERDDYVEDEDAEGEPDDDVYIDTADAVEDEDGENEEVEDEDED